MRGNARYPGGPLTLTSCDRNQQAEGAGARPAHPRTPTHTEPAGSSRGWSLFLPELEAGRVRDTPPGPRGLQPNCDHTGATRRAGRVWGQGDERGPLIRPHCKNQRLVDAREGSRGRGGGGAEARGSPGEEGRGTALPSWSKPLTTEGRAGAGWAHGVPLLPDFLPSEGPVLASLLPPLLRVPGVVAGLGGPSKPGLTSAVVPARSHGGSSQDQHPRGPGLWGGG